MRPFLSDSREASCASSESTDAVADVVTPVFDAIDVSESDSSPPLLDDEDAPRKSDLLSFAAAASRACCNCRSSSSLNPLTALASSSCAAKASCSRLVHFFSHDAFS